MLGSCACVCRARPPAWPQALATGVLTVVGTDHAAFNSTQKALGRHDFRVLPNGVNGLEERMHVVWQEMVVPGGGRGGVCWYICVTGPQSWRAGSQGLFIRGPFGRTFAISWTRDAEH